MKNREALEIYIHIPFCVKKCAYCDFVSGQASDAVKRAYVEALLCEIRLAAEAAGPDFYRVVSVFFGGGTPSIIDPVYIEEILAAVRAAFFVEANAEISLEANPGTLTADKLFRYRRAGINRLSIGLQSANDEELALLGRIHTFSEFVESYQAARAAGFSNISVDLMAALPGQTEQSFRRSLEAVTHLMPPPEHVSVYSLILEEETPFYETYHGKEEMLLPSEETERAMYYECRRILEAAGYHRYEISNFAKKGHECRHNIGYWTGVSYLGLGISAASYMRGRAAGAFSPGRRFVNTADRALYISRMREGQLSRIRKTEEAVTRERAMEEFMFLGLRMTDGVSETAFAAQFGEALESVYGAVLKKMERQGLMVKDGTWRLTDAGVDVSNYVMAEFLFD